MSTVLGIPGSMETHALTSVEPVGLMVFQTFFHAS